MSELTQRMAGHEPSLQTVEMVCDRLAELGLAVGPDTARGLVREVLAAEAPRVDARLREALDTALQTIRIAAQSAMGLLATTASEGRSKEPAPPEQLLVSRKPPVHQPAAHAPAHAPAQAPRKPSPPPPEQKKAEPRQSGPRRPRIDLEDEERRPVFRRPGRR
jgi:type IV secretory pathway VirB10-like protein